MGCLAKSRTPVAKGPGGEGERGPGARRGGTSTACSCGRPRVGGGECAACRARKRSEQASAAAQRATRSPGEPLRPADQARFGGWFKHDFSRVRVHPGGEAGQAAAQAGAAAWATGQRIGFAPGHYRPDTRSGQRLLAHELAHVVQQERGGGRPGGGSRGREDGAAGRGGSSREEAAAARAAGAWGARGSAPAQPLGTPGAVRFAPAPGAAPAGPAPAGPAPAPAAPAGPILALSACAAPNDTAAQDASDQMRTWLTQAIALLSGYVSDPTGAAHAPVAAALQLHFHRADAELGTAVMDRLRTVQGAVGAGSMGQCADATHPACEAGADGFASPTAGTVGLCPLFFTETLDTRANTLLHEGMHLHGATHNIPDRAYSHARYYATLTPEEAFDNADSFSNLVQDLAVGAGTSLAGAAGPPVDALRGCDPAQTDQIGRALALVHKWIDPAFNAVTDPSLSGQALVQTEVTRFLGDAKPATLRRASVAYAHVGKVLVKSMSLACDPGGPNCPAGSWVSSVPGKATLFVCPDWFGLGTEEVRAQALFDQLLQKEAGIHFVDTTEFISLARALVGITFAAPPAIPALPPPAPAPPAKKAPAGTP
jgi:hypothetical protein